MFTDIKQGEDYICGYFPIGQNKATKKIYAEIITTDFIKDYVDIFTEIGVKLKAVYSGESSLIRLTAIDSGTTVQDIRPADRRPHDNHDDPLGKWRILLFQQCPLLP